MSDLPADRASIYNELYSQDDIIAARQWMARYRDVMLMQAYFDESVGASKIVAMLAELMERRGMQVPEVKTDSTLYDLVGFDKELESLLKDFHDGPSPS